MTVKEHYASRTSACVLKICDCLDVSRLALVLKPASRLPALSCELRRVSRYLLFGLLLVRRLDFMWDEIMQKQCLNGDRIFLIRGFLTPEECAAFVARSEQEGYDDATITTSAGLVMNRDIRDNARLILDDPALADRLWERAQPLIPRNIDDSKALGLNERFRFYRYDLGQKFAPHFDGYFIIDAQAAGALNSLLAQVLADPDLSPAEQTKILRFAEPRIRALTRENREVAWERLQAEAEASPSDELPARRVTH